MTDSQQQKPVMSGGFYEKFCKPDERSTGQFIHTPFGDCEILKPDPANEGKSALQIVQKMIAILHRINERDKEKTKDIYFLIERSDHCC